jgi:hypothetical protein
MFLAASDACGPNACNHREACYTPTPFLDSSAVEQSTVNRLVAGSNPARGANLPIAMLDGLPQVLL